MEIPGGHQTKPAVFLYEFLGTAGLLISVNLGCEMMSTKMTAEAVSMTVFALIAIFGAACGAHYNPAVSTAVYIREAKFAEHFGLYLMILLAEMLGGAAGVMIVTLSVVRGGTLPEETKINLLCPTRAPWDPSPSLCDGRGYFLQSFLMETFVTFVFCAVVLAVKYD